MLCQETLDQAHKPISIVDVFLPDPIASDYDELVLFTPLILRDVRVAGDHLLGVVQLTILLVVEVSE